MKNEIQMYNQWQMEKQERIKLQNIIQSKQTHIIELERHKYTGTHSKVNAQKPSNWVPEVRALKSEHHR